MATGAPITPAWSVRCAFAEHHDGVREVYFSAVKVVVAGVLVMLGCSDELPEPPAGELLVTGVCTTTSPSTFASRGAALYWISPCESAIRMVSKLDGAVDVFVNDQPNAAMLAVDEGFLYWGRAADSGRGDLVRASLVDRTAVVIASAQTEMFGFLPQQLAVDDTMLYRSRFFEIVAMPKDGGGSQQEIAVGNSGPFLITDADYVYWANLHSVYRQRKGTAAAELLAQGGSAIFTPLATTYSALFYWQDGRLYRVDKNTAASAVSLLDDTAPRAFVSDGSAHLYWQSGAHLVQGTEDGVVTPIARVHGNVAALAVDEESVYWVDSGNIYRSPK